LFTFTFREGYHLRVSVRRAIRIPDDVLKEGERAAGASRAAGNVIK